MYDGRYTDEQSAGDDTTFRSPYYAANDAMELPSLNTFDDDLNPENLDDKSDEPDVTVRHVVRGCIYIMERKLTRF